VDAVHLTQTEGWGTLTAIFDSYGERPLKRPWSLESDSELSNPESPSEGLAKRFKQAASFDR